MSLNLWPEAWDALRGFVIEQTGIPIEKIYRLRHIAQADYKTITPPYAIIEIPTTQASEEWGGACNQAYVPNISFFLVKEKQQGQEDDPVLEATLSDMEDALRATGIGYGQVVEVGMPDVSLNNRINVELTTKGVSHFGGVITAQILLIKP